MRVVSNKILGVSMAVGALIASIGLGAHPAVIDIQAAPATPVHVSPPPPSPSPRPSPPPATNYDPRQDYWTGQGSAGGAPGGAGGAGGAGGGG